MSGHNVHSVDVRYKNGDWVVYQLDSSRFNVGKIKRDYTIQFYHGYRTLGEARDAVDQKASRSAKRKLV